jgi:HAD superfamily hydrolase (TIGR01490 family)
MALAIFDLDETLIAGDSDYSWGQFLVCQGKVDARQYHDKNEKFYQDYQRGQLDIREYLAFALQPLARLSREELSALHRQFMAEVIQPMWLPGAVELLHQHRSAGDFLLVITSTNRFVVEPICSRLGVDDLIATELELVDGRYTGDIVGEPSFREGKVSRLQAWLAETGHAIEGSYFYSDSANDLPLLEVVSHPVAVDPDARLAEVAAARGWASISLRGDAG